METGSPDVARQSMQRTLRAATNVAALGFVALAARRLRARRRARRNRPVDDRGTDIHIQYEVHPRPRFGEYWGLPRHRELYDVVDANGLQYRRILDEICEHAGSLRRIPLSSQEERSPRWVNGYLPGLDTAALYAFVTDRRPSLYIEVGSGNSTRVVRRAIDDHALATRIVSIDPHPRAVCDEICDEVIRRPLEYTNLDVFARLAAGDMCFIDNSHCAFQNSDVTVAFVEVLPRLAPGVLVGIHDIYLPDDYPPEWQDRWYNEQYLLATALLGGGARISVHFPAWHVARDPAYEPSVRSLWKDIGVDGVEPHGNAFWMLTQ